MNHLMKLPESCISAILSLTTPADAAKSSVVSKGFKSASESDVVWERFLDDHDDKFIDSTLLTISATKKELFLSLCDSHILLHGDKLSFSLDRWSGKKCLMVAAKALSIAWVDNPRHWEWSARPDSRFPEVAILKSARWLDIRGKIATQMLSPKTNYAAYLVFNLMNNTNGIKTLNTVVRLVNQESENQAAKRATNVYIPNTSRFVFKDKTGALNEMCAKMRVDGWIEVQLGKFYNEGGDDNGEVEARSFEIKRLHDKSGLIVQGIEFRSQ